MKNIKDFIWECMLFQNPTEGNIPHWLLGIFAWLNVYIIVISFLNILKSLNYV